MREKSQTHLTMMATDSLKMKQEFQGKLQEQEKRFEEQEKRFEEQEKRFEEQEKRFQEKLHEQEKRFEGNLKNFENNALRLQKEQLPEAVKRKPTFNIPVPKVPHEFKLNNFANEKKYGDGVWKSPLMYTHAEGYKFCVGIESDGVDFQLLAVKGEYDDQLEWPAKARFTIELTNHYPNGHNKIVAPTVTWAKPTKDYQPMSTKLQRGEKFHGLVNASRLSYDAEDNTQYLKGDALHFIVAKVIFFQ